MARPLSFLAADLGAESGRVMVGRFDEIVTNAPRPGAAVGDAYARLLGMIRQ